MKKLILIIAFLLFSSMALSAPISIFVTDGFEAPSADSNAQYDFATISTYVDPALTKWNRLE